jgi:hypothetical protein
MAMKCMFMAGLVFSLGVSLMRASDDSVTRLSLRGVKALDVVIEPINENAQGLTQDDLQTDVELRCRQAGLKVEKVTAPFLYVNVGIQEVRHPDRPSANEYTASVVLNFEQVVFLERDKTVRMAATTWSVMEMVTGPSRDLRSFCRDAVRHLVDKFLNAFLEQNPK